MASPQRLTLRPSSLGFLSGFVILVSSSIWQIRDDARDDEDVYEGDLKKEEPAEPHELVVTETWQGPAHPHEHEEQHGDLREKRRDVKQAANDTSPTRCRPIDNDPVKAALPGGQRKVPAAEK